MTARETESGNKGYEIPSGFTSVQDGFLKADHVFGEGKRLWLFQVPKDIKLQDLDGMKVSFKKKGVRLREKSYEVSKNESYPDVANLNLLVSDEDGQPVLMPANFSGVVTMNWTPEPPEVVLEDSRRDDHASGGECARQRFFPFGSGEIVTLSKSPKKKSKKKKHCTKEEVQEDDPQLRKKSKKKKSPKGE